MPSGIDQMSRVPRPCASPWSPPTVPIAPRDRFEVAPIIRPPELTSRSPLRPRAIGAAVLAALALASPVAAQSPAAPASTSQPVLQKGDRLAIVGDSITEQRRYARILETYLTVAHPELDITVRNHGKGGEAAWDAVDRLDAEVLRFHPTVATLAYGMNDAGYAPPNPGNAQYFHDNYTDIVHKLDRAGVRVVVGSDGPLSKLPPWDFIAEGGATVDDLSASLRGMRDQAQRVAAENGAPFADVFSTLTSARSTALQRYGKDYAANIFGAEDGVHPEWSGHVAMAYAFLQAMGVDGNIGTITLDLSSGQSTASEGHHVDASTPGSVTVTSRRYPFCAEGAVDRPDSIRSGMSLVPFNADFNRFTLRVNGTTAARYVVRWGETSRIYTADELKAGINLAEDFVVNPFSAAFHRVDDAVEARQASESDEVWRVFGDHGGDAALLADAEAQRARLADDVRRAFVPVTHVISVTPYEGTTP